MPKRHWGNGFASGLIVGIGLAILAGIYFSPIEYASQSVGQVGYTQGNADSTKEQDHGESEGIWWRWNGPLISSSDTLAQWIVAALTFGAIIVTGVGVYYVRRTLIQADETNKAAVSAAVAANNANAIAEKMGQAQVRAYLTIDKIEVIPEPRAGRMFWNLEIFVYNSGQSPAKNIEARGTTNDQNTPYVAGGSKSIPSGKGGIVPLIFSTAEDSLVWQDADESVAMVVLGIEISYQDVFMKGGERTTFAGTAVGAFTPVGGEMNELHFIEDP